MKKISWFTSKVGKRIYRNDNGCRCRDCKKILEEGLIIRDKNHAEYLYATEVDFAPDLKYRKTK